MATGHVYVLSWFDSLGIPQLFGVDVDISRTHRYEATLSDFPVEDGSVVTDHVVLRPVSVSLEVLVSDTPIGNQKNFYRVGDNPDQRSRGRQAYELLTKLWKDKTLVDVITPFKVHENFIITSVSVPEDTGHHGGFYATVEMREVKFAQSKAVLVAAKRKALTKNAIKTATQLLKDGLTAAAEAKQELNRYLVELAQAGERKTARLEETLPVTDPGELRKLQNKYAREDIQRAFGG